MSIYGGLELFLRKKNTYFQNYYANKKMFVIQVSLANFYIIFYKIFILFTFFFLIEQGIFHQFFFYL